VGGLRAGAVIQRALCDGIKVGLAAAKVGEVQSVTKLATEDRTVEDVGIVEHRINDRNLALHVRFRKAEVINTADIEIAAVTSTGEIELRDRFHSRILERIGRVVSRQTRVVILQERFIGQQRAIPTQYPFVVEREEACAFQAAAPIAETGSRGAIAALEIILVELINTCATD